MKNGVNGSEKKMRKEKESKEEKVKWKLEKQGRTKGRQQGDSVVQKSVWDFRGGKPPPP